MSFFRTAWHAGAQEYGAKRAEAYGRRAKLGAALGFFLAVILMIGIVYVAQGPWG